MKTQCFVCDKGGRGVEYDAGELGLTMHAKCASALCTELVMRSCEIRRGRHGGADPTASQLAAIRAAARKAVGA